MDAWHTMKERERLEQELRGVRSSEENLKNEIIYLKHQIEHLQKKLERAESLAVSNENA